MKKLIISLLLICIIPTIAFGLTYTVDYKATGTEYKSLRYMVTLATTNSKKCTIYLPHNSNSDQTVYTLANVDCNIPDYIFLDVANGAKLNLIGSGNVYIYKMGNIGNSQYWIDLDSTGKVYFRDGSVKEVYPEWWDAPGDDAVKDTDAIQAAINCGSYIPVSFMPGKQYLIALDTPGAYSLFTLKSGTKILGNGATLKIADGAGAFYSIFYSVSNVSDISISGVTFDHNTQNNPIVGVTDMGINRRTTLFINTGDSCSGLDFSNNIIKNENGENTIYLGDGGLKKVKITKNSFEGICTDPNGIDHDHSTLYLHADEVSVIDNFFEGADWNCPPRCCIETHCDKSIVSGNIIQKYGSGMNVTGVSYVDSEQNIVSNNTLLVSFDGILLWSCTLGAHTTGYGLKNLIISNNIIKVMQATYYKGTDHGIYGINIIYQSNLPCKNIIIDSNLVEFEQEDTTPSYTAQTGNIGIGSRSNDPNYVVENLYIKNNTILNAPKAGIRLSSVVKNSEISGNTIVNAGQGDDILPPYYDCPVFIGIKSVTGKLIIDNNKIIDNFNITRMDYAFYIEGTATDIIELSNNSVSVLGATKTAYTYPYSLSATGAVPFIRNDQHDVWVNPPYGCKAGSNIIDTSTGYKYFVPVTQTLWNKEFYAASAPVAGTHQIGDRVINSSPSIGQPKAWRCSTAGVPGVWTSEGNL
jgi:hypothetical protein